MDVDDEKRQLEHARQALVEEFAGQLPREQVEQRFGSIVEQFATAPVRSFVPVLVHRRTREHLKHAGRP